MGTTLEGKQINQTYQGLLKTTDNNEVGVSAKEITDGKGNGTGVTLDNSGNIVANATVTANAFVGDASQLTNVPNDVTSVNSQTGAVTLTTDEIAEGSNEYYTDAKVEANSAVAANTAKVGITTQQANDIQTNNSKVGITSEQSSEIAANTLKVGITTNQASAIVANTAKNTYPTDDASKLAGIEDNADVTDTTNVTSGLVSATSISEEDKATIRSNIGAGGATAVSSVNSQTGTVVLDTDDISEGTNKYTTAANLTKLGHISVSQAVDLDTIESDVTTNNAKVGITTQQASEISANTLKTGITPTQASNITTNNAKVSMVLGTSAGTALEGDTELLQLGTTSTTALAGDTTTITAQQAADITTNNSKVGITTQQAADIVTNNSKNSYPSADSTKVGFISVTQAVDLDTLESNVTTNNAKVGYTDALVSANTDVVANTAKVGITTQQASDITTNNAKVGITSQQANDITANNAKISFDSASSTKLEGIAENATNVTNNNQITNGAGYINEASQTAQTNAIGNAIDFSARVTLAGGVAEGTSGIIKNLQNII